MKTIHEYEGGPAAVPQGDRVLIVSEGSIKVALDDVSAKGGWLRRSGPRLSALLVIVASATIGCFLTDIYCSRRNQAEMTDLIQASVRASDARVDAALARIESEMGTRDDRFAQQVDDMRTQIQQIPRAFDGEILALRDRLVKLADMRAAAQDDTPPLTIRLKPNARLHRR